MKKNSETDFEKWWKKHQPTGEFSSRKPQYSDVQVFTLIHDWTFTAHKDGLNAGRRAERKKNNPTVEVTAVVLNPDTGAMTIRKPELPAILPENQRKKLKAKGTK